MKIIQFLKDFKIIQNFYEIPSSVQNIILSLFYKNLSRNEKENYSEMINQVISTTTYQKTLIGFMNIENQNNKLRENKCEKNKHSIRK